MQRNPGTSEATDTLRKSPIFVAIIAALTGAVLAGFTALVGAVLPIPALAVPVAAAIGASGYLWAVFSSDNG